LSAQLPVLVATEQADGLPPSTLANPSFGEVYETMLPFVSNAVRRLGVGDSALDDVTQEVFVAIHRRLPAFEGRSSVKTWVFGILMGVVRNYRRTRRRKGRGLAIWSQVDDPSHLPDLTPDPYELASRTESLRIACRLIDELTELEFATFVMAEIDGLTVPEIASRLHANVNTIYSRLRSARLALRRGLEQVPGVQLGSVITSARSS
jgi:RNA polymerase sigma-70 factor (ECF subfamily)